MNDKRVFLGFGMGQISSLTLPFATGLKQENDITTVFAIPRNVPGFEGFFDKNQSFTVNFVDREDKTVKLSSYEVKACGNVKELEEAIGQSAAHHILYPSESISDITKIPGVKVAGAFSAVGPALPKVLKPTNEIAETMGAIPFYLCENFSQAKKDALENPGLYPNLKLRNCVIDRTSNGLEVVGNQVIIGTEPPGKCGGIMYASQPGEETFAKNVDGIDFHALSPEKITEKETVKWVGVNLVDYLIARHAAFKAIGLDATDDVFAKHPELGLEKIGKYIDTQTRQELTEMLGEVHKFLSKYGFDENLESFTADRIKMMEGDTFGRIIKIPDMPTYLTKKIFCKVEALGRGLIKEGEQPNRESMRDLKRALVQKQRTKPVAGTHELKFGK